VLRVLLQSSLGKKMKANAWDQGDGTYRVEFVPPEVSFYTCNVTLNGCTILEKPPVIQVKSIQSEKLDLCSMGLTFLPPYVGSLQSITFLNLSDNYLTKLPNEIGSLMNLEALNLNKNLLVALPSNLGNGNAVGVTDNVRKYEKFDDVEF
jgi:hypothetical protein